MRLRSSFAGCLVWLVAGSACDSRLLGVWSTPGQERPDAATDAAALADAPGAAAMADAPGAAPDAPSPSSPDAATDLPAALPAPPDGAPDLVPDLAPVPPDVRLEADAAPDALVRLDAPLSCTLTPSDWIGCNASCGLCGEMLTGFDLYLQNNPRCGLAVGRCDGATRTCNADCPRPTLADISCRPAAEGWPGCVGSGCAIDPAQVAAYPGYFTAHPFCHPANTAHSGNRVGCAAACPPPTESDRAERHGTGSWDGCRGYGIWVCVELVEGYPRYFKNHPFCVPNGTCDGAHFSCNEACPPPGPGDR